MPELLSPGVVTRQLPSARHIAPVAYGLPVFIATCEQGPPLTPTRVASWNEFTAGFRQGIQLAVNRAVYAYFLNCPHPAYIVHCPIADDASDGERLLVYQRALQATAGIDVSAVLLPGVTWTGHGKTILRWAVRHCERLGNRLLLIDLPPGVRLASQENVRRLALPESPAAATYYPWVRFDNPAAAAGGDPRVPRTVPVPASALAAAVWSNTDRNRGIWKAPAGTGSSLIGVRRLRFGVDRATQSELNPLGINCLRRLPGAGTVIWGARTLGGITDMQWRYISVARTAGHIRSSIERGTRWTVFEPNDTGLWNQLRTAVDVFMTGLYRAGALQGAKPEDAWFVQVGLGETMTRHDVDRGRVIIRIGCALAKPAEFTVVTVTQKAVG